MSPDWLGVNKGKRGGVKMKRIIVIMVSIMVAALLIATCCYANEMVSGVVKGFDGKTGRLVMQTAPQREATYFLPQTVTVYLRVKGKDNAVADEWRFLQDNLIKGTKIQVLQSGETVITIWILEVPR
jgi:flagellar basal body-associated protein FliL